MTCMHRFDRNLKKFRQTTPEIQRWINSIPKEKWSQAYDVGGRRYGHMTTNLSEAVNKVLKGAKNLLIIALVKCTYGRMVEYFVQRDVETRAELRAGNRFCKTLIEAIRKNQEDACSHQVRRYDIETTRFEVEEAFNPVTQSGGHTWAINLRRGTCQCGKFQAYKYPCSYAMAAYAAVSKDFYNLVDPVYSIENLSMRIANSGG